MPRKPASPAPGKSPRPPASTPAPATNPRLLQDQRWQRTVRFNWDKGGSKGGRK